MSEQFWKTYERVTAIAECEALSQVMPVFLSNAGKVTAPSTQNDLIVYDVGIGQGLVITRFEGYASAVPAHPIAGTIPPYSPFPIGATASPQGNATSEPTFQWNYFELTGPGLTVPMMKAMTGAVFDCDCILTVPQNSRVFLQHDDSTNAGDYCFSVRAYAWLVPQASLVNFTPLTTTFWSVF